MEFKIVISDAELGKSYQREIKDPEAMKLRNKKIGDEFEGSLVGLEGYILKITGGSDKGGFPMKKGVHKPEKRILMKEGTGYKARRKVRKRKRAIGELITDNIVQINTKIVKKGTKGVEDLLGITEGEKETAKPEETPTKEEKKPAEAPKKEEKVEKPQEVPKVEEKSRGKEKKPEEVKETQEEEKKEPSKQEEKPQEEPKKEGGK